MRWDGKKRKGKKRKEKKRKEREEGKQSAPADRGETHRPHVLAARPRRDVALVVVVVKANVAGIQQRALLVLLIPQRDGNRKGRPFVINAVFDAGTRGPYLVVVVVVVVLGRVLLIVHLVGHRERPGPRP